MLVHCGAGKGGGNHPVPLLSQTALWKRWKFPFPLLWPTMPLKRPCVLFLVTVVCHPLIHATKLNVRFRLLAARTTIVLVLARFMFDDFSWFLLERCLPTVSVSELCCAMYRRNRVVSHLFFLKCLWERNDELLHILFLLLGLCEPSGCKYAVFLLCALKDFAPSLRTRSSYSADSGFIPRLGGQVFWSIFFFFLVTSLGTSELLSWQFLKLSHSLYLAHTFQFIVPWSSYNSASCWCCSADRVFK